MNSQLYEQLAQKATRWLGSPMSLLLHTCFFVACFAAVLFGGVDFDKMLLVLTTIVSLEAIYLSLFIQMSVNMANASIDEVEQDIEEIQKDIDEVQEDVGEMQEDVEDIAEDVDEIQKDVDEIQEDVDELAEDDESESATYQTGSSHTSHKTVADIHTALEQLLRDLKQLDVK